MYTNTDRWIDNQTKKQGKKINKLQTNKHANAKKYN